jgi:hypothetical protein
MTNEQVARILRGAACFNLAGGISIIFLSDLVGPWVHFDVGRNMLFRLFVGGTAVLFGVAYLHAASAEARRATVLLYGSVLKYWAFAISLLCYFFFGLSGTMLLVFGVTNLCFALLFTRVLAVGKEVLPGPSRSATT